jgi:hypothetical protein
LRNARAVETETRCGGRHRCILHDTFECRIGLGRIQANSFLRSRTLREPWVALRALCPWLKRRPLVPSTLSQWQHANDSPRSATERAALGQSRCTR